MASLPNSISMTSFRDGVCCDIFTSFEWYGRTRSTTKQDSHSLTNMSTLFSGNFTRHHKWAILRTPILDRIPLLNRRSVKREVRINLNHSAHFPAPDQANILKLSQCPAHGAIDHAESIGNRSGAERMNHATVQVRKQQHQHPHGNALQAHPNDHADSID